MTTDDSLISLFCLPDFLSSLVDSVKDLRATGLARGLLEFRFRRGIAH